MTKEKQIEEIAKIFCGMKNGCDGCMWDKVYCNERKYAEEIYNAGYRKQSEGEWKDKHCTNCGKELLFEQGGTVFATTFRQYKTKYCHNCGAKMKGGE
jgi:membrane protease subunit (stomatin/prohibitin family)